MSWLQAKKPVTPGTKGGAFTRARNKFSQTTLPLISPRRGRRILRREQLFSVVRESLIRAGVLSTSYEFKVLTLDANGDHFLVLVDLALPAQAMPDEYLLEIERWVQDSARSRHGMDVRSLYWRRKAAHDQVGMALKAAVVAQTRREAVPMTPGMVLPAAVARPEPSPTAIPRPVIAPASAPAQVVGEDEVEAFRRALHSVAAPAYRLPADAQKTMAVPESHSDFAALSETQYGKL